MSKLDQILERIIEVKLASLMSDDSPSNKSLEDELVGKYVIVRTYSAGVHAGILAYRNGKECKLLKARRIWKWDGAATLSQLSIDGTSKPKDCKFPSPVDEIFLTEAIEYIPCTERARISIAEVPEWKA